MKAMILAAGRGSRMGSLTADIPKPLINLDGLTLIEHNILKLKQAGIQEIFINISYLGHKIKDFLGSGKNYGLKIKYLDELDNVLGTGGGVLNALSFIGNEPFWLINADVYSDYIIPKKFKLKKSFIGHLILVPNPEHHTNGDFFLSQNIVKYSNKKRPFTFSGMSFISPLLFNNIFKKKFPLEPLLDYMAKNNRLSGEVYDGVWSDIGSQARLNAMKRKLK